ncbi:GTPase IMAP family member 9-like [Morone saxatilis]|uniref:GTPase IMAP family member 9-like n=1 Tax=Morone saxatilis TaxID=34816 RepID=UPI0015E24A60|nr:GTPase IMAP family member 9-like [Morone saxatilis]
MTDSKQHLLHTDKPEIRIVLLGRSREGKTASVNTILLKPKSDLCHTEVCQKVTVNIDGQTVVVVDTPGLFKPGKSNVDRVKMIKKSISELAKPGPHVFLMVISVDSIFTNELKETAEILFRSFGKNTMAYTMVLFTCGDELKIRNQTIQDFICSNTDLHNLIIQCHWKYHVFDNTDESHDQVTDLLQKINSMIETRGGCYYTCKMLKEAEKALKEEEQHRMDWHQVTSRNYSSPIPPADPSDLLSEHCSPFHTPS